MAKIIKKGQKYLLHWKKNRVTAKRELSDIKNLHQLNGRYYTVVKPKMSGSFTIVDVQYKNDSFPVNANNLIEI